jgi:2-haloacid dehalogenase
MGITTVIFDFGGVVVQWDPRRIYRRFLDTEDEITRFFDEVGFAAWNLEQDRGRPWADAVSELSARFPHHQALIRAYDEHWEDSIAGPIEGTVQILQRLHASGYTLVGLTNWSADKFALTRSRYDLFSLFDEIIVSGEVGLVKPDTEIFDLMLRRIGRPAEECLFIDDSATNVEAAAAMGFATIRFGTPGQLEEELRIKGIGTLTRPTR